MNSRGRTSLKLAPLLVAGVFILFQFFSAERFTNPETGKSQRVALSTDQEEALGMQAFQEVLSTADVVASGPAADTVKRVSSKIAAQTGKGGIQSFLDDDAQTLGQGVMKVR